MSVLLFAFYLSATLFLAAYGIHAFRLLFWKWRHAPEYLRRLREAAARSPAGRTVFPRVVVQLPVYNEPAVVGRAIDSVCALDYPRERLEIQVLDDSTDETRDLIDAAAARHRARGVEITVLRRQGREGFKAGALAAGLARSDAEFCAIFDADFTPEPDFLRRALPLLDADPGAACLQGRWEHRNPRENLLTRAQAVGVDAHFFVQQLARAASGRFLNFNGTVGVWRRAAIEEAGGWRGDTLTEDLDLSYRAQLAGRRILFDPELAAPGELPETLSAYKAQQKRWACGSMQCGRKYLLPVWRSRLPLRVKTEATLHLYGYCASLGMLALVFLFPFGLATGLLVWSHPGLWPLWLAVWAGSLGPIAVAWEGQRARGRKLPLEIFVCVLLGLGSSANNAVGVLRGLFVPVREFVRTPKRGGGKRRLRAAAPLVENSIACATLVAVSLLLLRMPLAPVVAASYASVGYWSWSGYWLLAESGRGGRRGEGVVS